VGDDRIDVIPNAADERRYQAQTPAQRAAARRSLGLPPSPTLVIAYVGALVAEKGIDDLLQAAAGQRLVLAGDGPGRAAFEQRAKELGLAATFLGSIEDPRPVYAAADLLVLASHSEVQPGVLIESALCGTPAIATDVGSVSDLVLDGVTGRLVPPHDPTALRAAIDQVLGDPATRRRMGEAAAAHAASHFSIGTVSAAWLSLLHRVTA
jgi:glycosyltransferase involved in cell wall biosynthesis